MRVWKGTGGDALTMQSEHGGPSTERFGCPRPVSGRGRAGSIFSPRVIALTVLGWVL